MRQQDTQLPIRFHGLLNAFFRHFYRVVIDVHLSTIFKQTNDQFFGFIDFQYWCFWTNSCGMIDSALLLFSRDGGGGGGGTGATGRLVRCRFKLCTDKFNNQRTRQCLHDMHEILVGRDIPTA